MDIGRREFLKVAGISALIAACGKAGFELLRPGQVDASVAPLTKGKRWAMAIDMRKVTPEIIKECRKACHEYHNVPEFGNPKVEIKWIWGEEYEHAFPDQHHEYAPIALIEKEFPVLCNHCSNPPCCRACPTGATWQREDGIVMMDWHRCIGCRFCMAACPYGSRSFNWGDPRKAPKELNPNFPTNPDFPTRTLGVVEKCTFCNERLAKGQLPICVEKANEMAEGSFIFGDLADPDSEIRKVLRKQYSIRRKTELGTHPNIYYIIA